MDLRLEDLQTEEMHVIDAAGATLGRDSRRSSITIPDPGVSGAHARIFSRSGRYYIEDTNSSNGTFIEGSRLRGETELKDGLVIALHKYKFRVVMEANGVAQPDTRLLKPKNDQQPRAMQQASTVLNDDEVGGIEGLDEPILEGSSLNRIDASGKPVKRRDSSTNRARELDESSASGMHRREVSLQDDFSGSRSEISQVGAANLSGGFGEALGYYMTAVPKLALAPVGATQQLIAEQPFPAMDKMDLVAWAAPPLLLGAFINLMATVILSIAAHTFGLSAIMQPMLYGAVSVVVGCLIAGWVWHPLVDWWMRLLKGDSNPRGRTNMLIGLYTSVAIVQVVAGVGVLFALFAGAGSIGPLLQIVPLFLTAFAGLISIYVLYAWHGHFRVLDLVPKIIMVLGVLLIANAAWGAVGLMRARSAAAAAAAAAKKAQEMAAQAQAEAARQVADAQAKAAAQARAAEAAKEDTPIAGQTGSSAATPSSAAQATREAPPREPPRPPPTRAEGDDTGGQRGSTRPLPTFAELNEHIDAIEKAVSADPSLLARMENALALYKKMHATQAKYHTKSKDQVSERIRQAELYGAIVETVEELYDKVSGR